MDNLGRSEGDKGTSKKFSVVSKSVFGSKVPQVAIANTAWIHLDPAGLWSFIQHKIIVTIPEHLIAAVIAAAAYPLGEPNEITAGRGVPGSPTNP